MDNGGVTTLPNSEIFEQLALMGYETDSDKLTFQKGNFSPQWRFFIHTILHCLSPKKTAWEQFSSNIATAIICLATTRTFNFSKFIFDAMVKNLDNPHKFLMYPRFIQICLNKQRRLLQPHTRTYSTPVLTQKVFSNMKRVTKGYSGEDTPLFASMITASETSPSRITSSPSLSPQHTPFTAPSTSQPSNIHTTPVTEEAASMPHESPLQSVHSLGRDEGSLSLHELTVLCTNLSNKVTSLEAELAQTKQTYGTALTKLIKKVKKLEQTVKTSQSRRRTRVVLSDEEEVSEDPSKQGRSLIEELDLDAEISLVPPHDAEIQEKISDDTEVLLEEEETAELVEEPTELVEDQGSGEKGEQEVSTAAANLVYIRRSAEKRKDKEKDDEEERKRTARDAEIAKHLQEEYDKARKKEVVAEIDTAHVIDWNDPFVIRYHALQNTPRSVAEVRKNMLMYLKNQGGYKMKDFKGMSYDDIRPIFEKVWDQVHSFMPMDSEEEVQRLKKRSRFPSIVSIVKRTVIFMLVEKDYLLTKGLATLMLCNKLRVDQQPNLSTARPKLSTDSTNIESMKLEAMVEERRIFKCWFYYHTTNGHQFTMSNRHQELASPEQTASGKDFSNPLMADSLPKTIWFSTHHALQHGYYRAKTGLLFIKEQIKESAAKGKAIMQESEPPKKIKKKEMIQISLDEEFAKSFYEEEQAQILQDEVYAKQVEAQWIADEERIPQEAKQTDEREKVINWNDPDVLRYHAVQNRPFSKAEVRKNMCTYLKNQGGYKMSHFKGMSYEDIRPIFERVWDQNQAFVPKDSEIEKEVMKRPGFDLQQESSKKTGGSRKKTLARKRAGEKQSKEGAKRQKTEYEKEKEELKAYLDLVPREEFAMEIESLGTKYPIVDWKTHVLTENFMYYQIIRADGGSKNYKIFSEMLDDFDRQDVMDLHRLVEERYATSRPEGYDLMLWGDLKILFQPDEEDEVWRHQHEYNLISWRLFDSCGIHILLMDNGIAIHMMIEKKYPLTQEMLSKMLSRKLEVDHENEMVFELLRCLSRMANNKVLFAFNSFFLASFCSVVSGGMGPSILADAIA
ncbi:hypothetical protein Tco_1001214, partial [Tanacetum coccineum]